MGGLEPFLLAIRGRGGRAASEHRNYLDAIFWIARTGSPWRDLPDEFGKWSSIYPESRRWTLAGLLEVSWKFSMIAARCPIRFK